MTSSGLGTLFRKCVAGLLAALFLFPSAMLPMHAAAEEEPVTILYLQKIVAEKPYEAPVKALIFKTFRQLEKHYDSVYAFRKIDRDTYLRSFCDTIAAKLDTVIYESGEEKDTYYADVLDKAGAAAYTKNGTIVLRPGTLNMDHVNLAHEIEHLNNEFSVTVSLEANSDRFTSPLHEGMSARAEDFTDPYPVRAMALWENETDRTVQIFKELIIRGDTEYTAVYQVYECLVEHLEILIGHKKLTEIINGEKDIIAALRKELLREFSENNTDAFLISFFTLLYYTGAKDLRELDMETEKRMLEEKYRPLSTLYASLADAPEKEIRRQYRILLHYANEIAEEHANTFTRLQKRTDLPADEKKDLLDDADKLQQKVRQIAVILEEKLNTFTYEDFLTEIRFFQALYAGMVSTEQLIIESNNYYDVLWDLFYAVETGCQTLLTERILSLENRDDIPVLREAFRYYSERVLLSCLEDGKNITADAFCEIRYEILHRQELILNRKKQIIPKNKAGIFILWN